MATIGYYSSVNVRPNDRPQLMTSRLFRFNKQYVAPPRIVPGLIQLDIDCRTSIRVATYASDITTKGFVMHSDSWADTINYSVDINWLQFAPAALDFQSGKFSTLEDHTSYKPQQKTSRRIDFTYPFVTLPKVLSFISEFDIDNKTSFRACTYVSDIDCEGFTIHLETWADTTLYSMEAYWVAYPEDREDTFSTTFNTMEVRPCTPQLRTSKEIDFGGQQFRHQPKVFIALSSFDVDKRASLRLHTYVNRVSETGLTWHVDGWADTVVYSGGGVILAFA